MTSGRAEKAAWTSVTRSPKGASRSAAAPRATGVTIEPDDAQARIGRQQCRTVSPASDGGVDEDAGGHRGENSDTTSSRSTGTCSNDWTICSPPTGWRNEG